jgi:L-lactate dehydrogenase complex protein LldE
MKVALFVPCYIDQLHPRVAVATLEVLERHGCEVAFPEEQTCCGQPMANAGYARAGAGAVEGFVAAFSGYDHVVAPSGSCVAHVRAHYRGLGPEADRVRERTWELCEFLTDVLEVRDPGATFPHRVGLHASCHGLRMLGLAKSSEVQGPPHDKVRGLLERVEGLELVEPDRPDECCGFGGTFAVTEEALSVKMGRDRIRDHRDHGAEVITGTDVSCLMHLDGILRRQARVGGRGEEPGLGERPGPDLPGAPGGSLRVVHVAEILAAREGRAP